MKQANYNFLVLLRMMVGLGVLGVLAWSMLQLLGGGPRPVKSLTQKIELITPARENELSGLAPQRLQEVADVPAGLFSYGGSISWAPIRRVVNPAVQEAWPQFQLRYIEPPLGAPGSTVAIQMLLKDELSFVQSARSLTEAEFQQARQRDLTLKQVSIALDAIVVAVHPELALTGLTLLQLLSIYSGKIQNWQQVGGPDRQIIPYTRAIATGGTVEQFQSQILAGANFGANVRTVRDTTEALRLIAENPGGIYYGSGATVIGQCTVKTLSLGKGPQSLIAPHLPPQITPAQCPQQRNQVNQEAIRSGSYPLTRRLFVIIKENGQPDQAAGNAYAELLLSNQGQALIESAGLTPLR